MRNTSVSKQNIQSLHIQEVPIVEVDTIIGLKNALGLESSRDVVERAAFEVSSRLNRLELALVTGDLAKTAKIASGLVGISEQIGLETFASIARDLVCSIHNNDFVAVAAISRRLIRHGEEALFAVVSYAEMPNCS